MHTPTHQHGFTLIELLLAVAISAILLSGINDLVKIGLDAYSNGRNTHELAYQAQFALERMSDAARATKSKTQTTAPASSTNNWFDSVTYCLNNIKQLIETNNPSCQCNGNCNVIANNVSNFSAQLTDGGHTSVVRLSLTLANGGSTQTLTSSVRLGGGTQ